MAKLSDVEKERKEAAMQNTLNAILVVAVLIATVTFQAGLSPPGSFWQDWGSDPSTKLDHGRPGLSVNGELEMGSFKWFVVFINVGFSASSCVILVLTAIPFLFKMKESLLSVSSALTTVATASTVLAYGVGLTMINEKNLLQQASYWSIPISACGLVTFVLAFLVWDRIKYSRELGGENRELGGEKGEGH